mmetsp:Transcript_15149/g.39121  ORF Transcript_15149/g.39121 Transcript_15149/m.39121 type:complete len:255 (+) Transcript_15149:508-1272(+)
MFLHGCVGAHAIKLLILLAVAHDRGASRLLCTCEHATHHDEICSAAERLGRVARARDASVGTNVAAKAMRSISALYDGGELRVAHTGLLARRAHTSGPDAHLDNISSVHDQLLSHLVGDHVPRQDGVLWPTSADLLDSANKKLRVAVGHVKADECYIRACGEDRVQLFHICTRCSGRGGNVRYYFGLLHCKCLPLVNCVVLVDRHHAVVLSHLSGHGEGSNRVHIGHDQRHADPLVFRPSELEAAVKIDLRSGL